MWSNQGKATTGIPAKISERGIDLPNVPVDALPGMKNGSNGKQIVCCVPEFSMLMCCRWFIRTEKATNGTAGSVDCDSIRSSATSLLVLATGRMR